MNIISATGDFYLSREDSHFFQVVSNSKLDLKKIIKNIYIFLKLLCIILMGYCCNSDDSFR